MPDLTDKNHWDHWKLQLSEREIRVCNIICKSDKPLGFNEISRMTELHQEVLSKILRRLLFSKDIERIDNKYGKCCSISQ